MMPYYEKLRGKYVSLASISLNDVEGYLQMKNSNSVMSRMVFNPSGQVYDLDMACDELNDLVFQNAFAVIDHDTKRMIGLLGLENHLLLNRRSNMWIQMYTDIDYGDQVLKGAEAVNLFLRYCYQFLNLHSVILTVPSFNMQALDICRNSAMQYYGNRSSSFQYSDGKFYDEIYFQCTPVLYEKNLNVRKNEFYFNGNGVSLNIPYHNLEQMHDKVEGDRICLVKYEGQEEWVSSLAIALNNGKLSIPLGEFKTNWNDYQVSDQLKAADYVIVKDQKFLGHIFLFNKDYNNRTASLEILIANPEEHGKGYGKEALQLLLDEQYQYGPFYNLLSTIIEFNKVSTRMHEDLGYHFIGRRLQAYFAYGKLQDMLQYEMTSDIFENQKRKGHSL